MDEIKESFKNGYVVQTLSGQRITIVSSKAIVDKKDKSVVVNDELVNLLDKLLKNK